jgi:GntR family transcriptional repressor for pyruvate dehydrogenase complex
MEIRNAHEMVPRTSLVDLVVRRIQDWVLKGEFKPGEKLPSEKEMIAQFKVSKSVLREAVSRLNGLRLIETYQGKGSFVSAESQTLLISMEMDSAGDDFSTHLWELRKIFEPQIARLAAQKRSEGDLLQLKKLLKDIDSAIERNEMGYREDDSLHITLAKTTHNPMLEKIAIIIARISEPYKRLSMDRSFRPAETRQEWHAIVRAVEKIDPEEAFISMSHHIQNSNQSFLTSNPAANNKQVEVNKAKHH